MESSAEQDGEFMAGLPVSGFVLDRLGPLVALCMYVCMHACMYVYSS